MTPRKKWKLIKVPGFVTLHHDGDTGFKIRYTDPVTGKDVKRVLPVFTFEDALEAVRGYNVEIAQSRSVPGMYAGKVERHQLSVRDALITAIKHAGGSKRVKADYVYSANRFMLWLADNHANVTGWEQITVPIIRAWVEQCESEVARVTVMNRLKPLRYASSYWNAESPDKYRDVLKQARIRLQREAPAEIAALDKDQLMAFLGWVKGNAMPALYTIAMITSHTGLRVREAAYLRHCDVDFNVGTITVTKTQYHIPKTDSSYRTIPVPRVVLECLREYIATAGIQSACNDGEIFLHRYGKPYTESSLTGACRDLMARARQVEGLSLPTGFSFRKLRATYATLADHAGADYKRLQRCLGHAAGDMLGQHYLKLSVDDLRARVTAPFEVFLEAKRNIQKHGD